jgi:dTDP-4-dehydrorhamnose reductase
LNVYGASKVAGEHLVRAAAPDSHLIVRSSSLYGCVTSKKGWTFPEMMLNKARAGEELKVVDDQVMAPTYTYDLASRVLELIERDATGTFHVANAGSCSWYEFACATFELVGLNAAVQPVSSGEFPAKAARPKYSVLTGNRRADIGLDPLRNWRDALKAYLVEKGEIE